MKFFLLANNDFDGIGQTLINLSLNLKKLNQEVEIGVLHCKINSNKINIIKRIFSLRVVSFLFNFLKIKKFKTLKKDFLELFWFGNTTINFKSIKKNIDKADVVIIFTFHKIVSNKIFEEIMKSNKVVFLRPLDLELATGGCHFNENCEEFMRDCNECPQLNFLNFLNITQKNLKEKKRIVDTYKPKVLVQNTYVEKIFSKSSIFKNSTTKIVRLDTRPERKKIYKKYEARNILKLDNNENLIMFGAFNLSSHLKGGHLLLESLKLLDLKYIQLHKNNHSFKKMRLLTIGEKNNFNVDLEHIKWTHLGSINSDKTLNLLYRAVDLLVCPSLRCFAPHIVSEAVENNLPVVSFDAGVAQDDVIDGLNGFLVPCYDTSIFAERIFQVLYNENFRKKINNLNKKIQADRHDDEATMIIKYAQKIIKENKSINHLE